MDQHPLHGSGPLRSGTARRRLKSAALRGGALAIGFWGHAAGGRVYAAPAVVIAEFHADAFIAIGADGQITLALGQVEVGPGAHMALAMLVAEALAVDIAAIAPRHAPQHALLACGACPDHCASVPTGIATVWEPLRRAATAARTMLVQAAAARWCVTAQSCCAEHGTVLHRASGRRLRYDELIVPAALLPVPQQPVLAAPSHAWLFALRAKELWAEEVLSATSTRVTVQHHIH